MKHFTAVVTLDRMVDGRWQKVQCRVDLAVDADALMVALGNRAIRNKSKRSRVMNGFVACEVRLIEVAT